MRDEGHSVAGLWARPSTFAAGKGESMRGVLPRSAADGIRSASGWVRRRSGALRRGVTTAGLAAGGVAWLAGAHGIADACWLVSAAFGLAYALWSAADAIRHGRLGVDVIALLALAGAVAVREYLAAAVISVMLASGRALEAWAAQRARQDLSALLDRAPRT